MSEGYYKNATFEGIDFSAKERPSGEFEGCSFIRCRLIKADLGGWEFNNCRFEDCDLSNARVVKTTFNQVKFKGCKMLGIHFDLVNAFVFTVGFEDCVLNFSSFYKRVLRQTSLVACQLVEVDFSEADLGGADFRRAVLTGAKFEQTRLEKTDFRDAVGFNIDPAINYLSKAKFSAASLAGLLAKYDLEVE